MPVSAPPSGPAVLRVAATERSTSETAKRPIIAGMKLTPPISSVLPKVKRGWPAGLSRPIVPMKSPIRSETSPFIGEPAEMKTAQLSPRQTSQKYSNELNFSATSASAGAAVTRTTVPKRPPMAEKTSPAPSATSDLPLRVIA